MGERLPTGWESGYTPRMGKKVPMGARVLCWRCLRHMQAHVGMMVVGLLWHRKLGHGEAWAREVTSSLDGFFSAGCGKIQSRLGGLAGSPGGFFRGRAGRGRDWIFFAGPGGEGA